jgi:hypothetical protein
MIDNASYEMNVYNTIHFITRVVDASDSEHVNEAVLLCGWCASAIGIFSFVKSVSV